MNISELAARAGVKVSTVRFYERRGLLPLPARSPGGYREFPDDEVARVRFLRRGQQLGFSLAELGELTALSGQRVLVTADVARIGHAKLAEIDERMADLARVRAALAGLLDQQCIDPDAACPIVGALGGEPVAQPA
ncbi:MAG: heavy metal-responsive transcriptional regulator [Propionibacteriales bacterium]|nr:heavy metal-responsive transcriptional regulator [Propionibacteriales bacterium]